MPTPARTSEAAIVRAARDLVESAGPDGLTMQAVAAAVGVRAPSLYRRVPSRADLLRLVVVDIAEELSATLEDVAHGEDAVGDLHRLAVAVRRFAHRNPIGYQLLFAPLPDDAQPDATLLARSSATILRAAEALVGPDRALEAARTVVAWLHGFISMELAGAFRLGGNLDDAYRFGADLLVTGLVSGRDDPGEIA